MCSTSTLLNNVELSTRRLFPLRNEAWEPSVSGHRKRV